MHRRESLLLGLHDHVAVRATQGGKQVELLGPIPTGYQLWHIKTCPELFQVLLWLLSPPQLLSTPAWVTL